MELQEKIYNILCVFADICERHNLTYWLTAGTLLGAVRHQGFIPWDDDIDVGMPVDDYKAFCRIAPQELPPDFFFQNIETDKGYVQLIPKIRKNNTLFIEKEYAPYNFHKGIYIDIFPYYGLPKKNPKRYQKHVQFFVRFWRMLVFIHLEKSKIKILIKKCVKWLFLSFYSFDKLYEKIEKLVVKYNYNDAEYVCCCYPLLVKDIFPKSVFEIGKKLPFADRSFCVPADYDRYLKVAYGDYMTLPPVEKRKTGHSIIEIQL